MERKTFISFLMSFIFLSGIFSQNENNPRLVRIQPYEEPGSIRKGLIQGQEQEKKYNAVAANIKEGTFYESFENGFPPAGWEVSGTAGVYNWRKFDGGGFITPQDGNFCAMFEIYAWGTAIVQANLVTQPMKPVNGNVTFTYHVNYFFYDGNYGSSALLLVDVYDVEEDRWYESTENAISGLADAGWVKKTIQLDNYLGQDFTGKVIRIRFRGISDTGSYDLAIDNVSGPAMDEAVLKMDGILEYSKIPDSQLENEIILDVRAHNWGETLANPTNVLFDIHLDGNSIFKSTSPLRIPFNSMESQDLSSGTAWKVSEAGTGDYIIHYSSDYVPTIADKKEFSITNDIYARDFPPISYDALLGFNSAGGIFGIPYEIKSECTVAGAEIEWHPGMGGSELEFEVLLYKVNQGGFIIGDEPVVSEIVTRQAYANGTTKRYPLRPTTLEAGRYMLCVRQLTTTSISMATDSQIENGQTYMIAGTNSQYNFTKIEGTGNLLLRMDLTPTHVVTIQVNDGANPVQAVNVDIKKAGKLIGIGATNAQGQLEAWLADGDYTYSLYKDGYQWIIDENLTVSKHETITQTLTPVSDDATITALVSPFNPAYTEKYDVVITLRNAGTTNPLTGLNIEYDINGIKGIYSWQGNIAPGGQEDVTIYQEYDFTVEGKYEFTATVKFDEDGNPVNDTYSTTIEVFDAFPVPFSEDFDNIPSGQAYPPFWVVENANGDTQNWKVFNSTASPSSSPANSAPNALIIEWNEEMDMDDWIFTPLISIESGKVYKLSFYYGTRAGKEKLKVHMGLSPSSGAMQPEPLVDFGEFEHNAKSSGYLYEERIFKAGESGNYCFGFHGYSRRNQYALLLDDIALEELPDTETPDIGIEEIISPSGILDINNEYPVTVTLKNYSYITVNSARISYSVDGGEPVETDWQGTLPGGGTIDVTLDEKIFFTQEAENIIIEVCTSLPNGETDANGDNDCRSVTVNIIDPNSIGQHYEEEIYVYPNPFDNEIFINDVQQSIERVYITTVTGLRIMDIELNKTNSISTHALNNGVYFVILIDKSGKQVIHKMIKK